MFFRELLEGEQRCHCNLYVEMAPEKYHQFSVSHIINFRTDCQRKGTFNLRPDAQQDRIEQEMGKIVSKGPILLKKDKKITPTCSPCLRFIAIL
jgi:hypothetical protein